MVFASPPAAAHQASIVYSRIAVSGRSVEYTFQLADSELGPALGVGERAATREETLAGRAHLFGYLMDRVAVTNAGYRCEPRPGALELRDKADGFFAFATVDYQCKRTCADVAVRYQLFFDLDPRHQGFASIEEPGQPPRQHVFRASERELQLERRVTLLDHVRDFLRLGVEHIFTGYDHLAFLFGLLVVARLSSLRSGIRDVLGVVTAFTVAHSITLIAAGLGKAQLPARIVEPAIALSIVYVAVENLLNPKPRFRWLLTFGFGLVHGFGFASLLREIGLPPSGQVWSLLSFNLGVELGQLAVVALAAPMLFLLSRSTGAGGAHRLWPIAGLSALAVLLFRRFDLPWPQLVAVVICAPALWCWLVPRFGYDRVVRRWGSWILVGLATLWFFERALMKSYLGGALG